MITVKSSLYIKLRKSRVRNGFIDDDANHNINKNIDVYLILRVNYLYNVRPGKRLSCKITFIVIIIIIIIFVKYLIIY